MLKKHDHVHDHQVCANCGITTGAGVDWPQIHPYQDEHPDEFGECWDGRCPVCGSGDMKMEVKST